MATSVPSSITSGLILAANTARRGALVRNTDANTLYLHLGSSAASATNHSVALATNTHFEVPRQYIGAIQGVWSAAGVGVSLATEW